MYSEIGKKREIKQNEKCRYVKYKHEKEMKKSLKKRKGNINWNLKGECGWKEEN